MKKLILILLILCSPAYAAKKKAVPIAPPEVKKVECIKSEEFIKSLSAKVTISDREDFSGDTLERLRTKIKESDKIPELPDATDALTLYRNGPLNYIIILYHNECIMGSTRIPVKDFREMLREDDVL